MRRHLVTCLILLALPSLSHGDDALYLQKLQQLAQQKNLAERSEWSALLHYRPRIFSSGVKSLVDAPSFFNAPDGKHDPTAELEATLASFFSSVDDANADRHPQCVFIARYHWLKRELAIDSQRLAEQPCAGFQAWSKGLNAQQLTLVFPSAYLNNPASMFGHTLLRVDAKDQDENTRLLAYALNFAAMTDQERGIIFGYKGLFGGYQGRFSIAPYYVKVKEYSEIENRDIWEYRLNLTPEEIERFLMHAWEMQQAYFDYYFLDENCSYHLLSLLEVARPGLNLTDKLRWWVIPADTIRKVTKDDDLLEEIRFRPARNMILRQRLRDMTGSQQDMARRLAEGKLKPQAASLQRLDPVNQARVLELALDYAAYQQISASQKENRSGDDSFTLLKARSQLKVADQTPRIPMPEVRPDQGHRSARVGIGYGYETSLGAFAQFELRPAYHDLLDPEGGYTRGAQIEFLDVNLRYYRNRKKLDLQQLDFIDVVSLSPRNRILKPYSWQANASLVRKRFGKEDRALVGDLSTGAGLSYELLGGTLSYALAKGSVQLSSRFNDKVAAGIGPRIGVVDDISKRWRIHLFAETQHFFIGASKPSYELGLSQQINLAKQSALRFKVSRKREFGNAFTTGDLSLHLYF
ncbi:MAG: DUF4105 domain-containing protein [Pseudomonadota bacterium]